MEHGKGKREMHHFAPVIESINTSPLCFAQQNIGEKQINGSSFALCDMCFAQQNIGEKQRSGSDDERGWKYGI